MLTIVSPAIQTVICKKVNNSDRTKSVRTLDKEEEEEEKKRGKSRDRELNTISGLK